MHPHLELVRANQMQVNNLSQSSSISDMAMIDTQGLLMEAGSLVFKAIKSGEMANILLGLVALAVEALRPLALQNRDLEPKPDNFPQVYEMVAIMRLLSDGINRCSSGELDQFSTLYNLCAHLAKDFLNADFDKAIELYITWFGTSPVAIPRLTPMASTDRSKCLDLSDCLFE